MKNTHRLILINILEMGKFNEKQLAYSRLQYYKHREQKLEQKKRYNSTPFGRAVNLLSTYNKSDRDNGRGEGDLSAQWIVENIFTKPCAHCGKTGWDVIGCNRLDDSKPHTMDNVEPCCGHCNKILENNKRKIKIYQYTLDGELVKVWESRSDVREANFDDRLVNACCKGGFFSKSRNKWINIKQYKGYIWSYTPL